MFRRKSGADIEGEVCPYCEFVNNLGSTTCSQCYYDLNKAPRDQGEPISAEISNSIFDELMSDDDDSWEEGDALEVVLSLDQDPLEIDQYEATNFESEEPEEIDFLKSSSPELHNTVAHEPAEVDIADVGDVIDGVTKLDFSKVDPFDEVSEPVHQGKGAVFSPSAPAKLDDDLLGHVGGSELPSLPSDDLYENKVDLTTKKAPAPTPAVVLPSNPVIRDSIPEQYESISEPVPETPVTEAIAPTPVVENEEPQPIESGPIPTPAPAPVIESRIWPWVSGDAWDARQVHREVVLALEQVKGGKVDQATSTIDALGPHLTDDNIDLIYHIGMVLKQLGRIEEVKSMLERANLAMPNNEHVSSAMAHLGV